MKHVDAVRRS